MKALTGKEEGKKNGRHEERTDEMERRKERSRIGRRKLKMTKGTT